jgi:hypothetical protein
MYLLLNPMFKWLHSGGRMKLIAVDVVRDAAEKMNNI